MRKPTQQEQHRAGKASEAREGQEGPGDEVQRSWPADRQCGDNSVREWQGEKMKGKSQGCRSHDHPLTGRPEAVESLAVTSDGRGIQHSMLKLAAWAA